MLPPPPLALHMSSEAPNAAHDDDQPCLGAKLDSEQESSLRRSILTVYNDQSLTTAQKSRKVQVPLPHPPAPLSCLGSN